MVAQQVAALTASIGATAGGRFSSLAEMQAYATKLSDINQKDSVIKGLMGSDWTTIWGPVVWVNSAQRGDKLVVDNTMACYYSPSQRLFVLAIAGTNPASMFDWGQEDVDIKKLVPWASVCPISGPDSGNISAGTCNGIEALLGMKFNGALMVSTLAQYIDQHSIKGATIAIGGHSLGGALAPCMGLYLHDNRVALRLADQKIAVYAYAGPTPGDHLFATYYGTRIIGSSLAYSSVYNTIDLVPQAWVIESLQTIPTIYGDNIPLKDTPNNTFLGVLATNMQVSSVLAGGLLHPRKRYTQVVLGREPFTAAFNSDVYKNYSNKLADDLSVLPVDNTYLPELGALLNVLCQADAQHTAAYFGGVIYLSQHTKENPQGVWKSAPVHGYLDIDDYTLEYQKNLEANPPPSPLVGGFAALAIKKITGLDLHDVAVLSTAAPKTTEDPAAIA